jgi:hypothetical protein
MILIFIFLVQAYKHYFLLLELRYNLKNFKWYFRKIYYIIEENQ